MCTHFVVSNNFWVDFVNTYWEKTPIVLKKPFEQFLSKPTEVFKAMVMASEVVRQSDGYRGSIRFSLKDWHIKYSPLEERLPFAEDGDLASYTQRVNSLLGGLPYGMIINYYQVYDPQLWLRLREILHPLYNLIGLPADAEITAFIGNYSGKDLLRVHTDPESIFAYVVQGRKRFHIWPVGYFQAKGLPWVKDRLQLADYQPYLCDALTLEGEPGDWLYWPANAPHVGESIDGLSISLSIALDMSKNKTMEFVSAALDKKIKQCLPTAYFERQEIHAPYPFNGDALQQSATILPTALQPVVTAYQDSLAELDNLLKQAWLERLTAFGFNEVPAPRRAIALQDEDIVQGDRRYPILWQHINTDKLICAANGHSVQLPDSPQLIQLLTALNSGISWRVRQLIETFNTHNNNVCFVLEMLHSFRALKAFRIPRNNVN